MTLPTQGTQDKDQIVTGVVVESQTFTAFG
jgi:hypothetical protein